MGTKGNNSKSWVLWEELEHLRVSPESGAVSIYKRQDPHLTQATEKRPYQSTSLSLIPVPAHFSGVIATVRFPERLLLQLFLPGRPPEIWSRTNELLKEGQWQKKVGTTQKV